MKAHNLILTLIIIVFILGCAGNTTVKNGDSVAVEYSASLENGTLIDDNEGEPLEFTVGAGEVIKGFNFGVLGMKVDQEKTVTISPNDAYGLHSNSKLMVEKVSILNESGVSQDIGNIMYAEFNNNRERGVIKENNGTHVVIDFNHPLAGKTLIFKIKLVDITSHSESAIN